jgi:hypothetical protein
MNIMLGNLTVDQIEKRAGVTFSEELKALMNATHQPSATNIREGEWHCFDLPFNLVVGGMPLVVKIHDHLKVHSSDFLEPLQISLAVSKETRSNA